MKIKNIEKIVKKALEIYPAARDDDYLLIKGVFERIDWHVDYQYFGVIMVKHKEFNLPSLETITRARRKLQRDYPELRSSKRIEKERLKKEIEIYNYSLDDTNEL